MIPELHDAQDPVRRDRYDRPYIIPPGGGKPTPYMRVTTLAGTLEDRYHLERWKMRQVAIGLSLRPALQAMVASHREDKDTLNDVCEEAMQAAAASERASLGTALHAFAAQVDRGLPIISVPAEITRDLEAYRRATEKLEHLAIERFTVHDGLKVAGTPDRICRLPDGSCVVADLKTGESIDLARGAIGIQIALYAHSQYYDPGTGTRTDLPDVDQTRGLVIHLPAGTGEVNLRWIDLDRGWDAALTAHWTRAYRVDRKLLRGADDLQPRPPLLESLIDLATSVDELIALYREHKAEWLPIHTVRATARKAVIQGG